MPGPLWSSRWLCSWPSRPRWSVWPRSVGWDLRQVSVGLLAALAVAVACAASATQMPGAAELLQEALFAAAAGFLAGSFGLPSFSRARTPADARRVRPVSLRLKSRSSWRASSYTRRSPAARIRPPLAASSPSQVLIKPPGALDDRRQGDNIVRLQVGFDDEIDEPGGKPAIGVAVSPVSAGELFARPAR